ncbi:MAG: aldehyde dehydrogenase family protein, partial [Candidatus Nanopelagicaceae bacterium]
MSADIFEYSPAPESRAVVKLQNDYGHFINGKWVAPLSKKKFASINPATEEILAKVSQGSAADIDKAVKAARIAYNKVWSKTKPRERSKYLFRIARLIQERSREFAVLETLDNGKPIRETRDVDIPLAAAHFFYHAGWADKLEYAGYGENPKAYGVVAQIIPWNFPLLMLAWKVAPALATGN